MDLHLENAKVLYDSKNPTPEQREEAKRDRFCSLYAVPGEIDSLTKLHQQILGEDILAKAPRQEYQFSFCVESCTNAQAYELLDEIIDLVEAKDLWMGGGCAPYTRWNCVCDSIEIKLMSFLARWLKPVWKWLNQPCAEDSDG